MTFTHYGMFQSHPRLLREYSSRRTNLAKARPSRGKSYSPRPVSEAPPAAHDDVKPARASRRFVALAVIFYCALAWAAIFQGAKFAIGAMQQANVHFAQSATSN